MSSTKAFENIAFLGFVLVLMVKFDPWWVLLLFLWSWREDGS